MERTNAHESEGNGGRRKKGDEGRKQKHMKSKSDELELEVGGAARARVLHSYYTLGRQQAAARSRAVEQATRPWSRPLLCY